MGTRGRLLVILGAIVAAVALFFVVRAGGDDEGGDTTAAQATTAAEKTTTAAEEETRTAPAPPPPPPGPRQIVFRIPAGGPESIQRVRIEQGERVTLVIRSAVADHAHLHGYDLLADVASGRTARITFVADVPGRFEIELEDRGEQFAELTVAP